MAWMAAIGTKIAPPRFLLFCATFGVGVMMLIPTLGRARGILMGFDIAAALFLISIAPLLSSKAERMRAHARANDANRALLLGLSVAVSFVVLVAVFSEMRAKANSTTIALVVATLALCWIFANTIYTLHYAHLYYAPDGEEDRGGIDFPGGHDPDYGDFAYFAFTLGMTFQTSDVEITSPAIRRVVIGHCLAAFVYNIGILAFSINVLGGGR